jgi:hypothetical protein
MSYPFSTVDKGEARPSSERPRGSEEGHRFKGELVSEVNGYAKGYKNRSLQVTWAVLGHNLWVIARRATWKEDELVSLAA